MDHNTRTLFPGNYLHYFLPTVPEWGDDAQLAMQRVAALWRSMLRAGPAKQASALRTEQDFVLPTLRALGWTISVPIRSALELEATLPHYALYPDPSRQPVPYQGIEYASLTDPVYRQIPPVVLMVRPWSEPLARVSTGEGSANLERPNADQHIVRFLVQTETPWGILTNGHQWRVYRYRKEGTTSHYYAVDLMPVFDLNTLPPSGDTRENQFKRWWLFFRKQAFAPSDYGSTFVERMATGAQAYAGFVSSKLRSRAVNETIPELIAALIIYYRESAVRLTHTPDLNEVKEASLDFLYRLLFLIYGETNQLFPTLMPDYAGHGAKDVVSWALSCNPADDYAPAGTSSYARYEQVMALMQGIGSGQSEWALPRYGVRLSGDENGVPKLLREYRLNDWALARAVTALMRDMDQAYGALQVRDLLAACQDLSGYEVDLQNEATGASYFTHPELDPLDTARDVSPEHVQHYAMEHVLEAVLAPRRIAFTEAMDRVVNLRHRRKRVTEPMEIEALNNVLKRASQQVIDALLGIRILDPVMGTGERLLEVTDRLTDALICILQRYHDEHPRVPWIWNPIADVLNEERQRIQSTLMQDGLPPQDDDLSDTALLRHLIVSRCIYGMDMDPMSVKLSQLGLWMHAFTAAAPVGQLHSHLRNGNPLLGSQLTTMEQSLSAQLGAPVVMLPDVQQHVTMTVQARASDTAFTAHADPWEKLLPYKRMLDVYLAARMDMPGVRDLIKEQGVTLLDVLQGRVTLDATAEQTLEDVHSVWEEQRFFHYDLEFPEVFVSPDNVEEQGFDAILGDPANLPPLMRPSRDALVRLSDGAPIAETDDAWRNFVYRQFAKRCLGWLKADGHLGFVMGGRVMITRKTQPEHIFNALGL